ncbi:hypothetical protein [uncultured Nonlabens sp.]|uniref:hypothetical protein n=1 Tax=uncultured Nonlabens sp. TaxID=859306 RepID=UPI0026321DC9|nr:hypothetical protein [uncultured Nonlabens sp.]
MLLLIWNAGIIGIGQMKSYESSVIKSVKTNEDGTYQLTFLKSAFLSFTINADRYKKQELGEYINTRKVN